jgi:hypothetical protein
MNYCKNIQKSIDYIEKNIKEDIDIRKLSNLGIQQLIFIEYFRIYGESH